MQRQDLLDDVEPETGTARFADVVGTGFVVTIPDVRQFLRLDARTMVGDLQTVDLAELADRDVDDFILPAVFDGIAGQIGDDLLDLVLVCIDEGFLWRGEHKIVPLALLQDLVRCQNRSGDRREIGLRFIELYLFGLHGGHSRHIADEAAHALGLVDDDRQMRVAFLRIVTGQVADHFRVGADHGQRRFEIMGNIRNQILLPVIGLPKLVGRDIQGLGEVIDFRIGICLKLDVIIALTHFSGCLRDALDRLGNAVGKIHCQKEGDAQGNDGDVKQLILQNLHSRGDRIKRREDVEVDLLPGRAHQAELVG